MELFHSLLQTPYGALTAVLGVMVVGQFFSKLTRGMFPMVLALTILLLTLFWSGIFPLNMVSCTGINSDLFGLVSAMLIANLGTLINRREMIAQWKTVVIALMGIVVIILICLTIGAAIFGWDDAVAAAPPLTGAAIATALVREAADAVGNSHASLVALVCMSMQGIVGYPLTAICLQKEARRLVKAYQNGEVDVSEVIEVAAAETGSGTNTNLVLFKLGLISVISYVLQLITAALGFSISMYVWAMLLGFLGHEIGFLDNDCLTKANAYGLCITILMVYLFGGLSAYDLSTVLSAAGVAAGLILLCAAGMAVVAIIGSKIFKRSFYICYPIVLSAYLGFPVNVMLTNEALDFNTETPEERAYVSGELMPSMLVGSFVCVTIVSVIVAGILIPYIH